MGPVGDFLDETNMAPENGWLGDDPLLSETFWKAYFQGKLLVLGMVFFSLVSWNLASFAVMVHVGHVHHAYGTKEFANAQQAKKDLKSRSASLVGAT